MTVPHWSTQQRQTPKKSIHCKLGLHNWTSLDWRSAVNAGSVLFPDSIYNVERHCIECGKYERYKLNREWNYE